MLFQCFHTVGEYTEDIAEFANSWVVQISDDIACVPTASDFSSPCPADAEFTEVNQSRYMYILNLHCLVMVRESSNIHHVEKSLKSIQALRKGRFRSRLLLVNV